MRQIFAIDLDTLEAHLTINEGGREVRYTIGLEPDRSNALVTREVWDKDKAIENKSWFTSLESLGNETALPHAVMWAARGMWGVPLEFGPKVEAADDAREALAPAPVEEAPAPIPRRKK
jgi:hypothetical protein